MTDKGSPGAGLSERPGPKGPQNHAAHCCCNTPGDPDLGVFMQRPATDDYTIPRRLTTLRSDALTRAVGGQAAMDRATVRRGQGAGDPVPDELVN